MRSRVITIVIANDSEQISRQLAMAVIHVVGWRWLVAPDATSSLDEWRRTRARIIECVFDVGVDDFGDDVNNCCASFAISS